MYYASSYQCVLCTTPHLINVFSVLHLIRDGVQAMSSFDVFSALHLILLMCSLYYIKSLGGGGPPLYYTSSY
jgi:hypothetical protein